MKEVFERDQDDYLDISEPMNEHFYVFFENEWEEVAREFYKRNVKQEDAELELYEDDAFMNFAREKFFEYLDRDPQELFVC